MTAPEGQRRRSALTEQKPWAAEAHPPAESPAPAPRTLKPVRTAPARPGRTTEQTRARGRAADPAEANARTAFRNAVYAWASAESKAMQRLDRVGLELAAAQEHGCSPELLGEFVREACERYGLDLDTMPATVRNAIGLSVSE